MKNEWPNWKNKLEAPNCEGGIRLKDASKKGTQDLPLVSYVTVVRNNEETLERTIASVAEQSYSNVEHIVLDGCSTDGTLEIIQRHASSIDYYASEPDKGLYDALNKAVELCKGQLILILNSDDWLTPESAQIAVSKYRFGCSQLILGSATVLVDAEETITWKPTKVVANSVFSVANCNHNAIYASREAYEASGPYDSSYKIAGDFKWIMSCFWVDAVFDYTNEPLVNYSLGGLSSDVYWHMEESKRIIKEFFPFLLGNEVIFLHYVYYPWRHGFNYKITDFNALIEITNLTHRYSDKPKFMAALDFNHEFLSGDTEIEVAVVDRFKILKRVLRKNPVLFNAAKKIHKALNK